MSPVETPESGPWAELSRQVERVADRLRSIGLDRLARPDNAGVSLADEVHSACVVLAAHAQKLSVSDAVEPPRLADLGSGDQWTVIASEFIAIASRQVPADAAGAELIETQLRDLRRRL